MKKEQEMFRQGDVLIVRVDSMPEETTKLDHTVLAWGEITGHRHQVDVGALFETKNGELYLRTEKFAKVKHEEHRTIKLTPGTYKVIRQKEYHPEAVRQVAD